jgi:hypothetical protein
VSYEFSRAYDTTAPFAELTFSGPVDPIGRILGAGQFTMKFNMVLDAPMNGTVLKFTAGEMSNFQKVSAAGQADVYTFTYTPPPATRGGLTIEMPKGVVSSGGIPNLFNWWPYFLATP